jgi:hypothetical protein
MPSSIRLIGETASRIVHSIKPPAKEKPSPYSPSLPAAHGKKGMIAMTYGLSTRAFIEDGPTVQVAHADSLRSTARSWRALDEARRIKLIECALRPANDCNDALPL